MSGSGADTPPGAGLPEEVARTREHLENLLRRLDPEAARPAPAPPERPTVVLVGAPGRGRHALAAALLGHATLPGPASPAGPVSRAGGSGGALRITHGSDDEPRNPGRAPLRSVSPDTGRAPLRSVSPDVLHAPVPLLEELDLLLPVRPEPGTWPVDGATAALVLVDAAAPLGADELDALARAADRVDTVVLALTRIEAHRGWRTVLDADRALVADRVPRLAGAPWFPVSAALARRAVELEVPDGGPEVPDGASEVLRRRSGIAELQRELHRLVARRRRMLAEANALRVLAADLGAVARRADDTRAALRSPGAGDDLAHRRDELAAARADLRRGHHTRWRAALAAARVAAADDLAGRVRELAARTRADLEDADRDGLAAVPARVAGDVEALANAVVDGLGARLRALVSATLADLLPPGELAALRVTVPGPGSVAAPPAPPRRPRRAEDRLLVVAGASGGLGLSRLALLPLLAVPVAPAVLGAALVPVSVGLGLGAAGWMARTRRLAADRAHLRQWLTEALAEARADLDRVLADALIDAEREVTLALDEALERRTRDLDAAVLAVDRAARRDGAARTEAAREAELTARRAREGRDLAEDLLDRMARLRDRA